VCAWRHARAIALLPGTVAVAVPAIVLLAGAGPNVGWGLGGVGAALLVLSGCALIAAGLALWVWTLRLFMRIGNGTLAPWDPTRHLVITGPYSRVRNPMITAVFAVLLGEAALFGSPALLIWCALFLGINWVYFVLYEEPGLERRFGDDYRTYRRNVPRWIPRRTPWTPVGQHSAAPRDTQSGNIHTMGFLDRFFGRSTGPESQPAQHASASSPATSELTDEQALERYRYLVRTAPPDAIERAHEEAFANLTPEQRRIALRDLSAAVPEHERTGGDDPRSLARMATRAETSRPGTVERAFGGGGTLGGMGGTLLGSFAAAFAGSLVAQSLFSELGGEEAGAEDAGGAEGEASDAGGDAGGGDFGGGDIGGGDIGGGDIGF
jgi:protein-S-isoprenylcysteine O-methyltransferase Ste14